MLGHHFGIYGLVPMFHCEGLYSSKMALSIDQNGKQVFRFCLDHSHARNGRVIRKQLKQTFSTKQRNETRLKQSKRQLIARCCLLLRTLSRHIYRCTCTSGEEGQCKSHASLTQEHSKIVLAMAQNQMNLSRCQVH